MEKIRFPAKVVANNRVTIPQNFVEAYGIQQGDNVTVEIELRKESGKQLSAIHKAMRSQRVHNLADESGK